MLTKMLTNENYFSAENEWKYMGSSQLKSFMQCEAATMARLRGEWVPEVSAALLIGSYVDAHFEGTLDKFKEENPGIFKRDGTLKSEYEHANYIIARMERDRLFMLFMSGKKQVIKTGEIAGVPFKIKIDCLLDVDECSKIVDEFPAATEWFGFCDGAIVDEKVMKDFGTVWNAQARQHEHFIEAWGYDIQGAIYQAIEGNLLPFFIAAGTKEKPEPDIGIFVIPQDRLSAKLYEIEDIVPYYQLLKLGEAEPERCEQCAYCRQTKKLNTIKDYRETIA
jgi:hypothetical protein